MQKTIKRKNHEFLDNMVIMERYGVQKPNPFEEAVFYERITFNNGYSISIQANSQMYCSPKINTSKENYRNFEIACFDNSDRWIAVLLDKIDWDISEPFIKNKKFHMSSPLIDGSAIGTFVNKNEVEEAYQYLKKIPSRQVLIEKCVKINK